MKKVLFCLLITASFNASCSTVSDGTEPKLYPLGIKGINKITLIEVGVKSLAGKDLNISCKSFRLTKEDVEEYFHKAKKVSKNDYRHMLDWSPCYVKGEIILNNGDIGEWDIHQYKSGVINLGADKIIYMYCPSCKAEMFDNPEYINEKN
ncbi:MAG: hypothetical protein L3J98_14935 [Gammaproteobacteria bacterium]|nr:hypothetical protein [Gammaproteobacteria bacterium]